MLTIEGLRFKYKSGGWHTIYDANEGRWKSQPVEEGMEIIGLFGNADEDRIHTLGFMLWKPNPLAD